MEILAIIAFLVLAFVFLGVVGWGLKAFGWVFDFLKEGCFTSVGCLFWAAIILLLLLGMLA